MAAAVLRTVIMKCTALSYSVANGSVILYMPHYKFSFLILWYKFMTAACNFILVTSESFRSVKCEMMRVNRTIYQ